MSELIDASRAFALRRAAVEFGGGEISTEQLISLVAENTLLLVNEVGVIEPEARDRFLSVNNPLTACLDSDIHESGDETILEANRVFTQCDGGNVLRITTGLLDALASQLRPYVEQSGLDKDSAKAQSVILATAVRIGLSSWIFDTLDPRKQDDSEQRSIRNTGLEVGLEGLWHNQIGDIDAVMDVLRYRFIGYLGFAHLLKDPLFCTVQQIFQAYFDQEAVNRTAATEDKAYSLKFAMAHMLSRSEAEQLIKKFVRINQVVEKYSR